MKSNTTPFILTDSINRIDEILKGEDASYEEINDVPSRDRLTFTNGFYVDCSAMFVDIRGSSELPKKYNRPTLAKVYRAYISEVIAVFNNNLRCKEVEVNGDAIWGVFNTRTTDHVNELFDTAAIVSSLINILNYKLEVNRIDPLVTGIGIADGRALMIKAGHKGSNINNVVYMGDVVNEASNLCNFANKTYNDKSVMLSDLIYSNLNEHNKSLVSYNYSRQCYHGDIINVYMNDVLKKIRNY